MRAEACADDKYAALDMVIDKLTERLRRAGDKRQVHRGRRTPQSVGAAMAAVAPPSVVDSDTPATEDSVLSATRLSRSVRRSTAPRP